MNRPSFRRLRSALVALTLTAATAGTTVAVAGPASAAATACSTATSIKINSKTTTQTVTWGDSLSIAIDVTASCPGSSIDMPLAGNVTLYRSINGAAFTPIKSSPAGDAWMYTSLSAAKNVRYGAVYNSGTYSDRYTFSSSQSPTAPSVRVIRKVSNTYRSVRGGVIENFKVKPVASIKGLKAHVQIKKHGHWRKYKNIRVSAHGRIKFFMGIGKRFRIVLPAARGLSGSRTSTHHIVRV